MIENSSNAIKKPRDFDVLFGRGGEGNNHHGNKRYQLIVESRAWEYANLKGRNAKTNMAWEVVHQLKREGARFLGKDKLSGFYFETADEEFRKKVSQRLREMASLIRDYSSQGEEEIDGSSQGSQNRDVARKPVKDSGKQGTEDDSLLADMFADINMSHLFSPGFLDEPWYKDAHQEQEDVQPEVLLSSSFHSDLSPMSLQDMESDQAICGQLDDLSFSSLATLEPMTFTCTFDFSENFCIGTPAHQEERIISRTFAARSRQEFDNMRPPRSESGVFRPDTSKSDY